VASPDSLAGHPAVIGETGHTLFYEDVNYAALYALERITGSKEGSYAALSGYGAPRDNEATWVRTSTSKTPRRCAAACPASLPPASPATPSHPAAS